MTDALKNFFEIAFALRNECESSGDPLASLKIEALAKVCAEIVRLGEIPSQFYIEGNCPIHTQLVESLFEKLSIKIKITFEDTDYTSDGKLYWANFCTF